MKFEEKDRIGLGALVMYYSDLEKIDTDNPYFDIQDLLKYMNAHYPGLYETNENMHHFEISLRSFLTKAELRKSFPIAYNLDRAEQLRLNGLLMLDHCITLAKYLKEKRKIELEQDEIAYLYLIVFNYLWNKLTNKTIKQKVLVVSANDYQKATLMRKQLQIKKDYLELVPTLVNYYDIDNIDISQYDLLATDSWQDKRIAQIPLPLIKVEYKQFYVEPTISIQDHSFTYFFMKKYFKEEYFIKTEEINSYTKAFEFIKRFSEKQFNTSFEYFESLVERENFVSCEKNNLLAVVKSLDHYDYNTFFSVILCKKPFVWKHCSVQIIVFYHVGESQHVETLNLFNYIMSKIIRNYGIHSIGYKEWTYEKMLEILCND